MSSVLTFPPFPPLYQYFSHEAAHEQRVGSWSMEVGEEANSGAAGGSSRKEEYERAVLDDRRYFIAAFFPQQLAWLWKRRKGDGTKEKVDLATDYAPWYALGNVYIGSESYPSSLIFLHKTQLPLSLLRSTYLKALLHSSSQA